MVFLVGQICSWNVGTRNMRKEVWNGDEGFGIGFYKARVYVGTADSENM